MASIGMIKDSYENLSAALTETLITEAKLSEEKANAYVTDLKNLYETKPWRLDDISILIGKHGLGEILEMKQMEKVMSFSLSMYNACPNKYEFDMGEYMMSTQKRHEAMNPGAYKVGRNDPCPCGSGKKYKKCCGA
ncbi:hypothetical protein AGMMS49975_25620 [Clostridia bacterium]|nr:hypothetical protein AGMMS49975_25620 [Clostridia bacterium]